MTKEYTAKFYDKDAGTANNSNGRFTHDLYCGDDKKEAFAIARKELAKMAECDSNGNNDKDINDNIKSIMAGSSSYYYDQHTYHFVMFSKKN